MISETQMDFSFLTHVVYLFNAYYSSLSYLKPYGELAGTQEVLYRSLYR